VDKTTTLCSEEGKENEPLVDDDVDDIEEHEVK